MMLVVEVGLDGVEDLVGPMVIIFGKKLNKQVLLFWVLLSWYDVYFSILKWFYISLYINRPCPHPCYSISFGQAHDIVLCCIC